MMTEVRELVASVLNVPVTSVSDESGPENMEQWDSLAHITIVAALEERFGVNFEMTEILAIQSYGQLVEALRAHGAKSETRG